MAMPKLSLDLPRVPHPDECQACGATGDLTIRWREHDDQDRPTAVVVPLCKPCGDKIIGPHARLYAAMPHADPHPGSMAICVDCNHRDGVTCRHPKLTANGGPGLEIMVPVPSRVHVLCSPRSLSGWKTIYPHQPRTCEGLEDSR